MKVDYSAFSRKLMQIREDRGLTSQEIADATGMSAAAVCRYMNGSREPDIGAVFALADYFAVRPESLFGLEVEKE